MNPYFKEFSINIQRHLAYRSRVIIWFLVDTLHVIFLPFLWLTIYGSRENIEGFAKSDILTYYLLVLVVGLLARSHARLITQRDIIHGDLTVTLLKPFSYLLMRPFRELSFKVLMIAVAIPIVICGTLLFPGAIQSPTIWTTWILFPLALAFGYGISLCQQIIFGLMSFWIGETRSIDGLWNIAFYIFSGEIAPLVLLPASVQFAAQYLPFQYIISLPINIYLENLSPQIIFIQLMSSGAWLLFSVLLLLLVWRRGIRRYEGVGI